MVVIQKATDKDVRDIVSIHIDAFKDFFLTSLGRDFLSFYYSCFIKSNEGVVMLAKEGESVLGFSAATSICKGFNSRLIKQNFFAFVCLSIRLLFTNSKALLRLVKNLTKKSGIVEDDEDYAELYSIGVLSQGQGKGVGKKLLKETENAISRLNGGKISLTTDYYNNEKTIAFYKKMGYAVLYEFVTYPNRKMYRMIKNL
ncbi:GNAT family N-acetyltransferase [Bacteroides bouchesdurhonensis]